MALQGDSLEPGLGLDLDWLLLLEAEAEIAEDAAGDGERELGGGLTSAAQPPHLLPQLPPPRAASTELALYDAGIVSLSGLVVGGRPLRELTQLVSLRLHGNQIQRLEGLASLTSLQSLDLSANQLTGIGPGLETLVRLETLNLSANHIHTLDGLGGLVALRHLTLSYNRIGSLAGLAGLAQLTDLDLRGNAVASVGELTNLRGLPRLTNLLMLTPAVAASPTQQANPLCSDPDYRTLAFSNAPALVTLDGRDYDGRAVAPPAEGTGAEDMSYLNDSDESQLSAAPTSPPVKESPCHPLQTPHIDEALRLYRQHKLPQQIPSTAPDPYAGRLLQIEAAMQSLLARPARSQGTGARQERSTENRYARPHPSGTAGNYMDSRRRLPDQRPRAVVVAEEPVSGGSDLEGEADPGDGKAQAADPGATRPGRRRHGASAGDGTAASVTFQLGHELSDERTRRSRAEASLHQMAVQVEEEQDRLKAAVAATAACEAVISELEAALADRESRLFSAHADMETLARAKAEREGIVTHLQGLLADSQTARDAATTKLQRKDEELAAVQAQVQSLKRQQFEELKTVEIRSASAQTQLEVYKQSVQQLQRQVQDLQELLATREAEFQTQARGMVRREGAEMKRMLDAAHDTAANPVILDLQSKLAALRQAYTELEEELRTGLKAEARRYRQTRADRDSLQHELDLTSQALDEAHAASDKAKTTLGEMNQLVRAQNDKIAGLEAALATRASQCDALEAAQQESIAQSEAASKATANLEARADGLARQLEAEQSIVQGLREERGLWSRELAAQGASLSADRGRLEAKVTQYLSEAESARLAEQSLQDTVRIRAKMIDDQADTIRRLKVKLGEKERELATGLDEAARKQTDLADRLEAERALSQQLQDDLETLHGKRSGLKATVAEVTAELERQRRENETLRASWQEKGEVVHGMEQQLQSLQAAFKAKEDHLTAEAEAANRRAEAVQHDCGLRVEQLTAQVGAATAAAAALELDLAAARAQAADQGEHVRRCEAELRDLLHEMAEARKAHRRKQQRLAAALAEFDQ